MSALLAASVAIWLSGDPSLENGLRHATADLFTELGCAAEWSELPEISGATVLSRAPAAPGDVAVFVVSSERGVTLFFANHARVAKRQVTIADDTEVALEEIAHIIADHVDGLSRNVPLGVPREEAARVLQPEENALPPALPAPAVTPAPSPRSSHRGLSLNAGAFYRTDAWISDTLTHGPGVMLGLESRGSLRFGVRATGQFRLPMHFDGDVAGFDLRGGSVAVVGTIAAPVSHAWTLSVEAGGSACLVRLEPRATRSNNARLADARWIVDPMVRVGLAARYQPFRRVGFSLAVGTDIDLVDTRYNTTVAGVVQTELEPWPVRPFAELGVNLTVGR